MYALKCMTVVDINGRPLSVQDCWKLFNASNPKFIPLYVSYHHYRCEGWTPKYGLKYGTDWVLYQIGPTYYHAEMGIVIFECDSNGQVLDVDRQREMSWVNLLNVSRVSEHVRKGMVICAIHQPPNFDPKNTTTPECLHGFKVQEMKIERWIPAKHRDGASTSVLNPISAKPQPTT
eukprot:TRINITY_DN2624_c0_g1_i1.p1 TRINITY_DN2624_c0_g1~~TRINITY_DN2624_c0_g1_i1.p1  ORF type:complete len:176 (-),score=22.12 TRINITY_DN2624_c0_g1_i1:28-555(-)